MHSIKHINKFGNIFQGHPTYKRFFFKIVASLPHVLANIGNHASVFPEKFGTVSSALYFIPYLLLLFYTRNHYNREVLITRSTRGGVKQISCIRTCLVGVVIGKFHSDYSKRECSSSHLKFGRCANEEPSRRRLLGRRRCPAGPRFHYPKKKKDKKGRKNIARRLTRAALLWYSASTERATPSHHDCCLSTKLEESASIREHE